MSKKSLSFLFIGIFSFVLAGCTPEPDTNLISKVNNDRFTVTRVAVFEDTIAYQNVRGVYILKDNKTEKEYVGVSGVGISEIGIVSTGKTSYTIER